MQLGTFVQIKILSPETPQVATEEQYTYEPVKDLRYLFKEQAPEGNSYLFSLSPAVAGAPVKSWLNLKKKKKKDKHHQQISKMM